MKLTSYSTVALALLAAGVEARGQKRHSRNSARAARLQRRCNETDVPPTSTFDTAPIPTPTPTGDDSSSGGGSSSGATPFQNWAGSNLYYAAGLNADQRAYLLGGLQKAGMKVLRVWLDGQSSAGTKGTNIDAYPGLEPDNVGTFDDTVLNKLDDFMLDAQKYGIKLMISMHSFNALSGGDVYNKKYGTQGFYENSEAQAAFDARLQHVLNYTHKTLGKRYAELSDYIFAFEAQNEAMIGLGEGYIQQHQDWQCNRAKAIKSALGDSHILITTGGESWANESVQDGFLNCDAIDIVALHAYGSGDFNTDGLKKYVDRAKSAGKMLVMQEWGACYFDSANNNCQQSGVLDQGTRGNNIKNWGKQIIDSGMPWMYWCVLPNADPHYGWDYEVGIDDQGWDAILDASAYAASAQSAWDFSPWLLGSGGDSTPSETAAPTSAPTATETAVPQPTIDAPAPPAATTGNFPKNKVFSGSKFVPFPHSHFPSISLRDFAACTTLRV
ncbi:glycoside hydrolase [Exidia glandulosa HHB12029]|uniref:mannan endo-1,4-beta-mannosidase n=1 Tax=Exidia glandulosa HHB12029 TaxID=1314781 RepID=A0A165F8D4_EXIGL|nr:glycoside hydrolase [Exidia glandulosa HHB12029]